ncbi:MAG: penicillin-binding transpeptidase domain-containing protein, partial [Christensenellales bacterium]
LTQSDVRGVKLDDSLKYYVEPVDGLNLKLNIDVNIQVLLEGVLEQIFIDHNPKKASILVLDPATSKVLGLAISPGFDLNDIPRDNIKELMEMSKNIAVTDVFEPGSTFKILTLSAALSENLTNENERFFCPGYRMVDGEKIKCWKTLGHGSQTLVEAVQNSCNCCFMDLGLRLGKERLYKYLKAFGIGSKSSVDISGESGGILLDENLVKDVDLARIAFGQTVAVSGIQLANAFCSIINGGTLNTPRLLSSCFDECGNTIYQSKTVAKNSTVTKEVGEKIRYLLEQAVSKTGEMSFVEGYRIAGKTGTAQKYGEDGKIARGKYVSSFFGFLNQGESPEYAVLICVDEPSSGAYYGSVVAKPYAKTIYEGIVKYKGILPAGEIKNSTFEVPQFCGMSVSQAVAKLDKMGIYYEVDGEGENVISQFPYAGTTVSSDSTVVIKIA